MRLTHLFILGLFACASFVQAQDSHRFRAGIYGGATIYPAITGLAGVQIDHSFSKRLRAGVRASLIDFVGPCSDADPVLDPDVCIADGRIYAAFLLFLTERRRRTTEPYVELGFGLYHFTDQIKNGAVAGYAEAGAGLELWLLRFGLRYARILDTDVEDLLGRKFAYLTPVLGVNVPF
jgi:hypothetical protein